MNQKTVAEVAERVKEQLTLLKGLEEDGDRSGPERDIGEELFRHIFEEDTAIIGPWHMRTSGKQKDERYAGFKEKWDTLCSDLALSGNTRDLNAWCRSAAVLKMLDESGYDTSDLTWEELKRLQQTKSSRKICEECRDKLPAAPDAVVQCPNGEGSAGRSEDPRQEAVTAPTEQPSEPVPVGVPEPSEEAMPAGDSPVTAFEENPRPHLHIAGTESDVEDRDTDDSEDSPDTDAEGSDDVSMLVRNLLDNPQSFQEDAEFLIDASNPASFAALSDEDKAELLERLAQARLRYFAMSEAFGQIESAVSWSRRMPRPVG